MLADDSRVVRWAGPVFALCAVLLLPWTIYLAYSLPSREVAPNYDVAWAGFDILLMVVLASTAYFALRRSRYLASTAAAAATMLLVDAWFDVVTSPASRRPEAVALAILVELPLAAVCGWLSHHTQQLSERRIVLLLRRGKRRARR